MPDPLYIDEIQFSDATYEIRDTAARNALGGKEDTTNKVISIDQNSTNDEYPSAKCVYDIVGDIETALQALIGGNTP